MNSMINHEIINTTAAAGNIGKQLLDAGKLTVNQAEKVLLLQKESNLRFGQAAIQLGYITEADIQDVLAHQFAYPYLSSGQSGIDERIIAAYKPFDPRVEALRSLRSQLLLSWVENGNKSIALASYDAGITTELLAANLAVVFSQLGEHTLLVDANLRSPHQHALFGQTNRIGLSDVLANRAGLEAIQKIGDLRDLSVLTAGTQAPNPQELLSRDSFSQLVTELANQYDVVIYHTSPLMNAVDAQLIAARTKGVLLVVNRNKTPVKGLATTKEQLESSGAEILGCVLATPDEQYK
ncbi:chain length determinant protein tyrosine kinase EpsG [Janthinobacterium sp. B9-8]|uniref:chain length determinant protein tyrosine kinase EpsG n=1 Tax=Janthinobacterium sp. B9-8 TaxID=1236179 RepID=UPI00061D2754|nr:chain length determinant protein tyrosine kinase EpsG [Janthinobacterium sp. B9-8]AMC36793.1 chain length determinant protein tyrosine kinase EpsG [Janthinobacterium sp. B9-8]